MVELANDLTHELQEITDSASAEDRAERVAVLNKRFLNASARAFAINGTPILKGADGSDSPGDAYAEALKNLAREVGRVRASFPSATYDGEVDEKLLFIAIAKAQGANGNPDELKDAGMRYMQDIDNESHSTIPGERLPAYYGSDKLKDALEIPDDIQVSSFDSSPVPSVPPMSKKSQDSSPASDQDEEDADVDS